LKEEGKAYTRRQAFTDSKLVNQSRGVGAIHRPRLFNAAVGGVEDAAQRDRQQETCPGKEAKPSLCNRRVALQSSSPLSQATGPAPPR